MYAVSVLCLVSLIWAPDFDYCASQGKHYFGYKLHVLCGLSGVIHSYDPPKASVYDINYMKDIKPLYRDCCIFGDKGYSVRKSNLTFSRRSISDLNAPTGSTKRTGSPPSSLSQRQERGLKFCFRNLLISYSSSGTTPRKPADFLTE